MTAQLPPLTVRYDRRADSGMEAASTRDLADQVIHLAVDRKTTGQVEGRWAITGEVPAGTAVTITSTSNGGFAGILVNAVTADGAAVGGLDRASIAEDLLVIRGAGAGQCTMALQRS
jgi:hypothetical protein